jgi:hypothetical protein
MSSNDILVRLRYLDAYPKTLEDFRIKTYGGAAGKQTNTLSVPHFTSILYPASMLRLEERGESTFAGI